MTLALGCWAFSAAASLADDWTADKLRGQALQLVENQWQPLSRGMIVPDSRVVRTLANGRVTFTRGNETVEIGPNTQIQIFDRAGSKPFTTVKQYFGTVAVEAEVQQVQHFAVQTPYLAAVVKGTRFTVTSSDKGGSVSVRRGHVAVEDRQDKTHVILAVGQTASITEGAGGTLEIRGSGKLPQVLDAKGRPVGPQSGTTDAKAAARLAAAQATLLKTPEAKAAAKAAEEAAKAAEKAVKDAEKSAKDAQKAEEKAAKDAEKAADGGAKGASSGPGGSSDSGGKGKGKGGKD
jgi:hypothetical protein